MQATKCRNAWAIEEPSFLQATWKSQERGPDLSTTDSKEEHPYSSHDYEVPLHKVPLMWSKPQSSTPVGMPDPPIPVPQTTKS